VLKDILEHVGFAVNMHPVFDVTRNALEDDYKLVFICEKK
jgi:hypothetical protein